MDVFVLKTQNGVSEEELQKVFSVIGNVHIIPSYNNESAVRDAIPLTHFNLEKGKPIDSVANKVQHLHAWEEIIKLGEDSAIVVLDTVRLVDSFVKQMPAGVPKGADICIFSATNLQINGTHLNGTDWVMLDTDDKTFNNICNAYLITASAAKKLFSRKNELLNTPEPFALWINSMSNYMSLDRIATYMSFQSTSSKPIYTKIA